MATIPLTISGIKEAQSQLKALGEEFDRLKDDPIESDKLAKQFNKLSNEVHQAEEALSELNKSGKNLTATFEEIYGDGIQPMTTRIGELEDRLYELANAGQQNSQEFKDMATEAARLRQNIIDTDRQVDLLAENRGLSVLGTGFSQIGESLLRLDFERAAMDAKALNGAFSNLGQRGAQAFKGLASTVGQLGKTFAKMGAALLANPIFLMAAVITALVAAVIGLMNELGLLQPLLDAIGEVFGWIKDRIMDLVQAIKDFSDWIGITNFALQDLAKEQQKNAQDVIDRTKEVQENITTRYDREIALAQIAGEDTTQTEIKKQVSIIKTAEIRKKALDAQLNAAEIAGNLDEEALQKIRDQIKETEKLIDQSNFEIKKINAQADADEEKRRQDQVAKDRAAYQKRLQEQQAFEKMRLQVARQIQDLELQLQEDGINKDLELNAVKYQRLIEDTQKNEQLTAEERTRLIALYNEQEFEARKEIELSYQQKLDEAVKAATKEKEEREKAEREKRLQAEKEMADNLLKINQENLAKQKAQEQAAADARVTLAENTVGALTGIEQLLAATGAETAGLQKTIALVQIAVDTAKSISAVVAGATAAAAAGGPAAPFLIAGYIASGIGTVTSAIAAAYTALQSAPSLGGSVSGGGGAAASVASATPSQPSFELFGQPNDFNNLGNTENEDNAQSINVTALVSEVELTASQAKAQKLKDNATL